MSTSKKVILWLFLWPFLLLVLIFHPKTDLFSRFALVGIAGLSAAIIILSWPQQEPVRPTVAPYPTRHIEPTMTPTETEFRLKMTEIASVPKRAARTAPSFYYAPTPVPDSCRIKGNVDDRRNTRIYHCPNWPAYSGIVMNGMEGDRYFCSEAEAQAAGFRKPQNVKISCIP